MRVKVFKEAFGSTSKIDGWLNHNKNIKIHFIKQSMNDSGMILTTIWFEAIIRQPNK